MEEKKLGNGAQYQTVLEVTNALVKVPKLSDFMRLVPGGYPVASVPDHWAHGKPIPRRDKSLTETAIILNCNFFGIEERDLGRRIVANVKVIQKTTSRGQVYPMLDITKASGEAICEMKIYLSADESKSLFPATYVRMQGSDSVVAFAPLPARVPKEEKKEAMAS